MSHPSCMVCITYQQGTWLMWLAIATAQNANRRPNTYKLLMLASIRQKAEETGTILPGLDSLREMAERNVAQKVGVACRARRG